MWGFAMRLVTAFVAILLTLSLLGFCRAQDAKAPGKQDVKKDGDKDNPPDKKKADDKKKGDKKTPATPTFTYGQTFIGKLMKIDANGELTVQIAYKIKEYLPDAQQRLINWQNDVNNKKIQIAKAQNQQQYLQYVAEYQKALASPPVLTTDKDMTKDFVLKPAKDMKLRVAIPEIKYDTKGNPIPFTKETLKELAGPEGYPGYPTEIVTLQTNQTVQVFLSKPKAKDPKKKTGPDITDIIGGGNPKDNPMMEEDLSIPRVLVIVVLKQ
jgi:hypothetical protein